MPRIVLVGIVNCTPDSFSDGIGALQHLDIEGHVSSTKIFVDRAQALLDSGAQMLDVGGDSTRPGSHCTADEEEWRRIEPILTRFCHRVPVSVDTHKAEIARRAINAGAAMINDVTGGINPRLVEAVADSSALYTYMFNSYGGAHNFEPQAGQNLSTANVVSTISSWAISQALLLKSQGIDIHRQVTDTGLGGFVSPDPTVSNHIIEHYWDICTSTTQRMFGCSRKGFLKQKGEVSILERDPISAQIGCQISQTAPANTTVYLRIHNVALQKALLKNCATPIDV